MKNFFLRLVSSIIIAPIFLYALYEVSYLFYAISLFILFASYYEINKNIKQKKIIYFLYLIILLCIFCLFIVRGYGYEKYILCVWILSIVWFSDIGGYLFGKIFKGPKLSKYSPNKTISGLFGSIIFSQFSSLIPIYFLNNFYINLKFIFVQFLFCIISVLGDIFFSYIKRINNIKDYSNLIPGHGGILDRIDGMIFVIIFYCLLILTNAI